MEPPNNFIVTDVHPTSPSAYSLGISSVIPSKAQATSSLKPTETPLPAPFAPTSQSTKFQYAAFPKKAPAAAAAASSSSSSQAPIGTTTSSNAGSQVVILAQIIIVIGLILVELTIVAIVLGLHKLTHRNPSPSPLLIKSSSSVYAHKGPERRRRSLAPYLQRKAELEDEQRKRHELHGGEGEQRLVHELDRECEVLQVADDVGGRVLSLKGIKDTFEMPERDSGRFLKTVDRLGRCELAGDECARELDSELLM